MYALLTLLRTDTDNAAVCVEQLDDIELKVDNQTLLYQLKHSMKPNPNPITLSSRSLWRTFSVWIDALPSITLSETTLHLVVVGKIAQDSPLAALAVRNADRSDLKTALVAEATRVMTARDQAEKAGERPLPFGDRIDSCKAFYALSDTDKINLLRRMLIMQESPRIDEVEGQVAAHLTILPAAQRGPIARRLLEWWDLQIVYSLCEKRTRVISRSELQSKISEIVGDIEQDRVIPDFETVNPPESYQPDGMLTRQIQLVDGLRTDLAKAIREEWRAREQRSKWINEKPSMASVIARYDHILEEHWADRHRRMVEECAHAGSAEKCASGLKILRWTHDEAPKGVQPITDGWNAPYYVRGSYQVLAINLKVGWHPEFETLLRNV